MTNLVTFDFDTFEELYIKNIFIHTFVHCYLNDDVIERIYSFLLPDTINFSRPIKICYEAKNHATWEWDIRSTNLKYYDFIFQISRHVWANYLDDVDFLFPCYRHQNSSFRYNNSNQITYPIH